MRKIKRTAYSFVYFGAAPALDLEQLFSGRAVVETVETAYAISILTGNELPIEEPDLELLRRVPVSRWAAVGEVVTANSEDRKRLRRLAEAGIVLTDDRDPRLMELRRR